ncbi:FkbM family methyltransferase [Candidatus Venteria ishoeyi]|uniref:Methyltransferase FkbM domain-containing protein n=1 Tax=Candidatus Venteria ishoeyi TaxID=1899563 RepID=A0A1H6FB71_9GAMM|nr:FkbM family methyltransferase [Candidatus Venteria ishoeyi]SEH06264.1 Uncharacterised protein [Candidatus Venteria ishoeyi]
MTTETDKTSSTALAAQTISVSPQATSVTYDEYLLERSKTQWQFGDWESLAQLDIKNLESHPDRAALTLFAATGLFQVGDNEKAKRCIVLAQEWGCSKQQVLYLLVSGVYNNLGRIAAFKEEQTEAEKLFKNAIFTGIPGEVQKLLVNSRIAEQLKQVQPLIISNFYSDASYTGVFYLPITLPNEVKKLIPFNTKYPEYIQIKGDELHFSTPDNKPVYLCSNKDGDFSSLPTVNQFHLNASADYLVYGKIFHIKNRSQVWGIEYDENRRISDSNSRVNSYDFFSFKVKTNGRHASYCILIRVVGNGCINIKKSFIKIIMRRNSVLSPLLRLMKLEDKTIYDYKLPNVQDLLDSEGDTNTNICLDYVQAKYLDNYFYFVHIKNDYIPSRISETKTFYEVNYLELLALLYQPGKIVIDGGANIGNHSIFFAGVLGANVIAFEPQPQNNFLLSINTSLNCLDDFIEIKKLAIGNKKGELTLCMAVPNNYGSFTSDASLVQQNKGAIPPKFKIPITSLDNEIFDVADKVSIIKLDLEGMELLALNGATNIIRQSKPVIAIECFKKVEFEKIKNFLSDFNYFVVDSANATPTFIFLSQDSPEHLKKLHFYLERKSIDNFKKNKSFNNE